MDDIDDSSRRFNRHFLRVFVGKASFHGIHSIFLVCIAFHVFFKRRDMLHPAVRATWIENMSQFNEFPRVGETYSIFELAIEIWIGRSS